MDELKNIYRQYKLIIWPVLSGVASIIILALVIIPQFMSYLQVKDEINKTQNHSSRLEAKASELEQFDESAAKKNLQTAFTVLPEDQDVPKSLAILQSLVKASALELKNTNFISTSKNSGGKSSFQLNLTVAGPIPLIRNFLLSLKGAPQIFQVESISIKFENMGSAVEATIPISVFYQNVSKTVTNSDQPVPQLSNDEIELLDKLSKITVGLEASSSAVSASVPLGKSDPFQ